MPTECSTTLWWRPRPSIRTRTPPPLPPQRSCRPICNNNNNSTHTIRSRPPARHHPLRPRRVQPWTRQQPLPTSTTINSNSNSNSNHSNQAQTPSTTTTQMAMTRSAIYSTARRRVARQRKRTTARARAATAAAIAALAAVVAVVAARAVRARWQRQWRRPARRAPWCC